MAEDALHPATVLVPILVANQAHGPAPLGEARLVRGGMA
jgi:hypothetical protein